MLVNFSAKITYNKIDIDIIKSYEFKWQFHNFTSIMKQMFDMVQKSMNWKISKSFVALKWWKSCQSEIAIFFWLIDTNLRNLLVYFAVLVKYDLYKIIKYWFLKLVYLCVIDFLRHHTILIENADKWNIYAEQKANNDSFGLLSAEHGWNWYFWIEYFNFILFNVPPLRWT